MQKQLLTNNMESIILKDFNEINLEIKEEANYILVTDDNSKNINFTINNNVNAYVVLFSKVNSSVNLKVEINENANLKIDVISMNNQTSNVYNFDLVGEYATLNMNVLSLAKEAKKEFLFYVNHLARETKSSVSNHGISFKNGKNYFKVNGVIKPGMKNSDVRQITKGLILEESGECLAEPVLLIDYHDVKAYHGATIGKISDDDLFYLMSRGLSKEDAFMLIINGLLEPFVKNITEETIKEEIMNAYYSYF